MTDCPLRCGEIGHTRSCPWRWEGPSALVPYAARAIASGQPVDAPIAGLVLVPDLLNVERAANGLEVASPTLIRGDGRSCSVYQVAS